MDETITTRTIGKNFAEVLEDFVLVEEPMSRLIFKPQVHEGGIRGTIIRQRRESNDDEWASEKAIPIRDLGKNETINIDLPTSAVRNLYEAISKVSAVVEEQGVQSGFRQYRVVDPDSVVITDENKKQYIKKLIDAGLDEEVWEEIVRSDPDIATRLASSRIMEERKNALIEFEESLDEGKDENYWQDFFKRNTWIFGYGLDYRFLDQVTDQPVYKGADFDGKGAERGDYLLSSQAENMFTVLVEIKRPDSKLISSEDEYRSDVAKLGSELLWPVSQLQINCDSWNRDGSRSDKGRDELEENDIYTCNPKGILVVGHTQQLNTRSKRNTFESFRREIRNPEILTFDELFERAKFIVFSQVDKREGEDS